MNSVRAPATRIHLTLSNLILRSPVAQSLTLIAQNRTKVISDTSLLPAKRPNDAVVSSTRVVLVEQSDILRTYTIEVVRGRVWHTHDLRGICRVAALGRCDATDRPHPLDARRVR